MRTQGSKLWGNGKSFLKLALWLSADPVWQFLNASSYSLHILTTNVHLKQLIYTGNNHNLDVLVTSSTRTWFKNIFFNIYFSLMQHLTLPTYTKQDNDYLHNILNCFLKVIFLLCYKQGILHSNIHICVYLYRASLETTVTSLLFPVKLTWLLQKLIMNLGSKPVVFYSCHFYAFGTADHSLSFGNLSPLLQRWYPASLVSRTSTSKSKPLLDFWHPLFPGFSATTPIAVDSL